MGMRGTAPPVQPGSDTMRGAILLATGAGLAIVLALPPPPGLSAAGRAALAVVLVAVVLWSTEALPTGATAVGAIILLALTGAVPDFQMALGGFARPTVFFLLGVLALGVAALESGLAARAAAALLAAARGRSGQLYVQMVASFALLALLLPSASTRGAIMLPVYEHALDLVQAPAGGRLRRAVMLGLASLNRLGSNALLTGGVTPVVAAALMGGFTWTSWLLFMGVPVYSLLVLGGVAVYLLTRPDREGLVESAWKVPREPLHGRERRALAIAAVVSALWMTDGLHHWDPAIPALLGAVAVVAPGIGVVTWREVESTLGWANLLVIAASPSLAQAMASSGAAGWLADWLRLGASPLAGRPFALAASLIAACLAFRAILPNISAYLTLLIPVVMELAPDLGLNPLVCGMLVTIAGDSVLFFPAQSSSSLIVTERGHLGPGPVAQLAAVMVALIPIVLLFVALPYWAWLLDKFPA